MRCLDVDEGNGCGERLKVERVEGRVQPRAVFLVFTGRLLVAGLSF
jgi:hypothetical protein